MDLGPPLDSSTIAADPHTNSILKNQAGAHLSEVLPMCLQTGLHPADFSFAKLYHALWQQGLSGHTIESFCEDIVLPSPDLQDKCLQDDSFREICFPINPDWADFFPPSIRSLYIRAEFHKTMFYLKRWLEEGRQSPVMSLEIDTERHMGEYVEDQGV